MSKRNPNEDIYFPVPHDFSLSQSLPVDENFGVKKQIIQQAIKSAYNLQTPSQPGPWSPDYEKEPEPLVSCDKVELVTCLMQSLQPKDAIEAVLAAQFIATYTQGMKSLQSGHAKLGMPLLEFGHKVLDILQKHRSRGLSK